MENEQTDKLRPCPFCGEEAILRGAYATETPRGCGIIAECTKCKASMWQYRGAQYGEYHQFLNRQESTAAWNHRPLETELLEALIYLAKLKDEKERDGATVWYQENRDRAWEEARATLAKARGQDHGDTE